MKNDAGTSDPSAMTPSVPDAGAMSPAPLPPSAMQPGPTDAAPMDSSAMDPSAAGSPPFDPNAFDPSTIDPSAFMAFFGAFALVGLAVLVFTIFLYWKIASKAGYSGALSLLMLVPIANVIMIIWFAFADWPVLKKARGEAV